MAIYKQDGVWHIYFRYKDILGKHHTIHRQSKEWKLKKEVVKVEQQLKLELTRNFDDLTYEQLFNLYIDERKDKSKNKSVHNMGLLSDKHVKPYFDKMSDITPNNIKKWQKHILSLGYANKYIYKIQTQLKTVINFGIKYDYINYNPFKFEIAQNKQEFKQEMLFWEQNEWEQFIKVVDDEYHLAFFSLLYWTGLRLGEALALQIKDVNLISGTINVNKTYNYFTKKLTTPKTSNSYRTVRLTDNIVILLSKLMVKHKQVIEFNQDVFIFGHDTPLHPATLRRRFYDYIELAEVKRIRIHDLRHTHVSLLRTLGFDRYEVARRLGNTPEMIDSTYTHWFESSQQEMVDKLNQFEKKSEYATILQPRINKH